MTRRTLRIALALSGLLTAAIFGACVDENVVYRDRELFEEPLAAAAGFLGYTDHDTKLTVCGNCHVEKQLDWQETAHAGAWADLKESSAASAVCEGCHTVGQLGNQATTDGGYVATREERYEDVQCESCHGPGLTHVTLPDASQPLASLSVSADLTTGCGECHKGAHQPFVEEWATSRHANLSASRAENPSCQGCHSGDGALAAWGVDTRYLEQEEGEHFAITCGVCHDPHGSPNTAQLRFSISVPSVEENLCMKCHQRRASPDPTSSRGPHSPQGPLLIGTAGWWPPSLEFTGPIYGTHGSEANPKLCASCHVASFEVNDPDGEFVAQATGHLFRPIPCLDEQGIPQPGSVECDDSERDFSACSQGACHGTPQVARNLKVNAELRIEDLVEEIDALIAQVPASESNTADNRYTVVEGSKFNSSLAKGEGAAVHNRFLVEALLTASIRELKSTYGLAPVNPDLSLEASSPSGVR